MSNSSILSKIKERRSGLVAEMTKISGTAVKFGRDLSAGEQVRFDEAFAEVEKLDERLVEIEAGEARAHELEESFRALTGRPIAYGHDVRSTNPLAFSTQSLDALQNALDTRSAGRFEGWNTEQRAALTSSTLGSPRVWGQNVINGPRLLHVVAGVPTEPAPAVSASHPVFTLPSSAASVGENVTLSEFSGSTANTVTIARYGRWTDASRESQLGTSAAGIVAQHAIGCAKDLDANLIGLVNTAAGGAVAFTADVPAAIRKAMAGVVDATAGSAEDVTILCHPDNAALLQSVTPIGGQTIAERFTEFSGALVYPSSAVPTGFMLVGNLKAGAHYFKAQDFLTETEVAVKTGTLTIASSVIGGYGITLAGGAFAKVDVVTP